MKREIKFRVWNGHKMEYNVMTGFLGVFYVQGIDENDLACMSPFNTKYHDDAPIMQFTGLKDKHGKDIYEGDIFNFGDKNIKYVVQWLDCGLKGKQIGSSSFVGFEYWHDVLEVVGNIHENPDLLK